jgi:ribonucleoside-diphosphate reductase beta chain
MTNLLELATQGDPGTIDDERQAAELTLLTPRELYELWERQQWSASTLDFSVDREQWPALDERARTRLMSRFSAFFIGEERVATAFAPFVGAAESLEEEAFLATQLVDEVRHTVFFDRFFEQVVGLDAQDTTEARLERTRQQVNADFGAVFDRRLMDIAERLRANPSDEETLVEGVTLYHIAIEGTLALTGQHLLTTLLEERDWLPGFLEGIKNVSRDEHRHLAFGSWYLQRKFRQDARCGDVIHRTLLEVLPLLQGVLVPADVKPGEASDALGYSQSDVNDFAARALTRRLKAIGVGLPRAAGGT